MTVMLQQEYAASGLLGVTELLGSPLCHTEQPHTKQGGNGSLWPIPASCCVGLLPVAGGEISPPLSAI